jgi:hypothetical protein
VNDLVFSAVAVCNKNNVTKATTGEDEKGEVYNYKYEYDTEGFPTKCTTKSMDGDVITFNYKYK